MAWQKHYATLSSQKEMTDAELFEKDAMDERPKDDFVEALHRGLAAVSKPIPSIKRLPKLGRLSQNDIKAILYSQNVFNEYAKSEESKRQAKAIKRVNQSRYMIAPHSAQSYIIRALYKSNAPLHRDQLVFEMERLGWHPKSVLYNRTRYVERLCQKNEYMFRRVKPATWELRAGFIEHPVSKPMKVNALLQSTTKSSVS